MFKNYKVVVAVSFPKGRKESCQILRQREITLGVSRASNLSSTSTNIPRGLAVRWLFGVPPCRKGTIHLQTPTSSPGYKPRPYDTALSVANHYTGWATKKNYTPLISCYVVVYNPLGVEKLHQVHSTFLHNSVTHQVLLFIQLSQGNAPAVKKMSRRSRERAGTGKERLYPLHKSHTTEVTASKARQGRLMSSGTPAMYR
ncbi:hypothetical protein TNCV_183931 [Trichonephila clavipes]|nr:hypothetical protein TNCV_183931 [Trichonephila clavipes]